MDLGVCQPAALKEPALPSSHKTRRRNGIHRDELSIRVVECRVDRVTMAAPPKKSVITAVAAAAAAINVINLIRMIPTKYGLLRTAGPVGLGPPSISPLSSPQFSSSFDEREILAGTRTIMPEDFNAF